MGSSQRNEESHQEIVDFSETVQYYRKNSGSTWAGPDKPPFGMDQITDEIEDLKKLNEGLINAIHDTNDWLIRTGRNGTAHQLKLQELIVENS